MLATGHGIAALLEIPGRAARRARVRHARAMRAASRAPRPAPAPAPQTRRAFMTDWGIPGDAKNSTSDRSPSLADARLCRPGVGDAEARGAGAGRARRRAACSDGTAPIRRRSTRTSVLRARARRSSTATRAGSHVDVAATAQGSVSRMGAAGGAQLPDSSDRSWERPDRCDLDAPGTWTHTSPQDALLDRRVLAAIQASSHPTAPCRGIVDVTRFGTVAAARALRDGSRRRRRLHRAAGGTQTCYYSRHAFSRRWCGRQARELMQARIERPAWACVGGPGPFETYARTCARRC